MQISENSLSLLTTLVKAISPLFSGVTSIWRFSPRKIRERKELERRKQMDRRHPENIAQRLRRGLRYRFQRDTGLGVLDPMGFDADKKSRLQESLWHEIVKYEFRERHGHREVSPMHALELAINAVWANRVKGPATRADQRMGFVIDSIADELLSKFDLNSIDKREADRRAAAAS